MEGCEAGAHDPRLDALEAKVDENCVGVEDQRGDTTHLLEHLAAHGEEGAVPDPLGAVPEDVLQTSLDYCQGALDRLHFCLYRGRVFGFVMQDGQNLAGFVDAATLGEPAGRLGHHEDEGDDEERENDREH